MLLMSGDDQDLSELEMFFFMVSRLLATAWGFCLLDNTSALR